MCRVSVCLVQRRFIYCESLSYLICVCEWCKCDIYACARVCVRAYVRARVCVCVCMCTRACACVWYIFKFKILYCPLFLLCARSIYSSFSQEVQFPFNAIAYTVAPFSKKNVHSFCDALKLKICFL